MLKLVILSDMFPRFQNGSEKEEGSSSLIAPAHEKKPLTIINGDNNHRQVYSGCHITQTN
jgi:hypothetical protein